MIGLHPKLFEQENAKEFNGKRDAQQYWKKSQVHGKAPAKTDEAYKEAYSDNDSIDLG